MEQGILLLEYDKDWNVTEDGTKAAYRLSAQKVPTEVEGLGRADVRVASADGTAGEYICLTVAWQEAAHG